MTYQVDDLDVGVLLYVLENSGATSTLITRALFADVKDHDAYHRAEVMVRYRLKRLQGWTLLEGWQDGRRRRYKTVKDRVFLGTGKLDLRAKGIGNPLSFDMGEFLVVTNGSSDITVRSIDVLEHYYTHTDEDEESPS